MTTEWNAAIEAAAELVGRNLVSAKEYPELILALRRDDVSDEPKCSDHPDAPHGFLRSASHTAGRYVCECEGWEPPVSDEAAPVAWMVYTKDGNGAYVTDNPTDISDGQVALPLYTQVMGGSLSAHKCSRTSDSEALAGTASHPTPNAEMERDCNTCANRGRIDGLSQETHCEHCIYQKQGRTDHYVAMEGK